MEFTFTTQVLEKLTTVNLSGNLMDKDAAEELNSTIDNDIINGNQYFILNLDSMDYLNSTGLNVLIGLLTKIRNAGGELVICSVPEKIKQLLLITKLNTVFNVAESLEEATKFIEKEIESNIPE